jgi:hypothetical protein
MKKITKRDVLVFIFGMLAMILIDIFTNLDQSVKALKRGWNSVQDSPK